MKLRLSPILLTFVLLHACTDEKKDGAQPETAEVPPKPADPVREAVVSPAEPDKREPPTAAALAPVIREEGEEGVVPRAISVELAEPIAHGADEPVLKGTVLEVSPATEGKLTMRSPSTLVFTPKNGFLPSTKYTVRLLAVETSRGLVKFSSSTVQERVFTTPAFRFVRVDFSAFDARKNRLETMLVFSAPVGVEDVKKEASFTSAGLPVGKVLFERTEHANVVRATVTDKRLEYGSVVDFSYETASGTVKIHDGKPITIHGSYIQEGASGFYVTVICNDAAAQTNNNRFYHWDNVLSRSFELSPRCVLEESDAQESVHFSPPVKFNISPTRGGFRIIGDFGRGTYSMRIDGNARSMDGGVLKAPYTATFSVPARKPQLSFVSQGRYLPKSAWTNLAVRHMNASQVELMVRHVPVENLVFWMSAPEEAPDDRTSDIVLKKKIALGGAADHLTTSFIDVSNLIAQPPRGLLELRVTTEGATATSRLLVTDLNLVAKLESETGRIFAWALDMHGNGPVPGVVVKAVVRSGRVFATCNTDRLGGCLLKPFADPSPSAEKLDPAEPFALIATREGDMTYLVFDQLRTEIADSQVHGRPYISDSPYRAGMYGDRGVYRPGETARVVAIVRNEKDVAPPVEMPIEVKLIDPRQKVAKKMLKKANAAGVIALDFKFDDFAPTGVYRVTLEAGKKSIGSHSFNVEELVPERMKVTADAAKSDFGAADKVPVKVSARYLFGGSAEGSRVELGCELRPAVFSPKTNNNYEYGVWRPAEKAPEPIALGTASGVLSAEGTAEVMCPPARERGGFTGTSRLSAKVAVFEAGSGRTTQADASALVHPEAYYIGLLSGTRVVKAGETFTVEGILVDWTGKPVDTISEVELELLHVENEHDWIYEEENGRWSYRYYTRLASEGKLPKAPVRGGKFTASISAGRNAGAFVVRAKAGKAQTDLRLEGNEPYWYWWSENEGGRDETPRPMKPAGVALTAPESIELGKKVTVTFDAPFTGKALMSIESNRVLVHEWIDMTAGKMEWSFTLNEHAPNVYVSAFVVKDPHADSAESFLPSRGFGVQSMRVEPKAFAHEVKLETPKEVRSSSKLEVTIDLGELDDPTFATIAAVDEGILSLTKFQTPDPLALLFDRRRLGVSTHETIGWNLLLPAGGNSRSEGGDADGSGLGRVQPVKPVALWSGLIEIPKSGKASVTFDVPQYRGSLRVMVVTAGPKKMGHASANVIVRDPIVVQTTLPRFLSYNDRAEVPVFLTNMSGKAATIEVTVSAETLAVPGLVRAIPESGDPIEVEGAASKKIELADGASGTAVFRIKALRAVGAAKLKVVAVSGDSRSEESLDVPFLPAAPKSRVVQRIELTAGKNDVKQYLSGWVPTTEKSTLWVTGNPYGESFDNLRYLLHYPYGCIEQTTSATRPLLYVSSFVQNVDPELVAREKIESMVMGGVNRILSMQTPSGGFAYWPGGQEPTPWGTAYATHLLIDAQKLRYPVPEERVKDAIDWIERELTTRYENKNTKQRDWYYWENAEAYLQYVLAVSGKGRKGRIERLIEEERAVAKKDSESAEQLYMLQAALYLSGDHSYEAELKKPDTSPISPERKNSWSFYSDRRRRGFMLSTFTDLFGADPAGEKLAQLVAEGLRGNQSSWYTTQELVWGLTGLGKRVGETAKDFTPATLTANGKKLSSEESAAGAKSSDRSWTVARASEHDELSVEVTDTKGGKVFLILSSEGVRVDAKYQLGGQGLSLNRTYRRSSGEPFDLQDGSIKLGDVVYAEITLSNRTGERIQNIALTDRFPASFEIENPRLGRGSTVLTWVQPDELWTLDYMNLRDERIELFGALEGGQSKKFVYALRAVTAGQFVVPPVEAEAMYYPDHWAREAGGRALIKGLIKE
jgi:uncharacterized protein YfaS (alpha-2-macroglobulin family)